MAENNRVNGSSPERRPVLVSSSSPSNEPSSSGLSSLQSFSLGHASSPNNLFSLTVPVRLDILYVLINAARRAQCALPPAPLHDGRPASISTSHGPPAPCAGSCCQSACRCVPNCACVQRQPSGSQRCGAAPGGYGGHRGLNGGILECQNDGHRWSSTAQRSDGSGRSDHSQPRMAGGWNRAQSPTGWRGSQRRGAAGGEHGNEDRWQGNQQDFRRAWGDRRQGAAESGSQGWRREGSSFRSSKKRNQEGSHWPNPQEAPEAKRSMFGASGSGWQKTQGVGETAGFVSKAADAGPAKLASLESKEDWEAEYESEPTVTAATESAPDASHQNDHSDPCKVSEGGADECVTSADSPKLEPSTSPLPESDGKDQGAADRGEEIDVGLSSKQDVFVSFLKNLHSDVPEKASSEDSSELVIDIAADPPQPDEEEQPPESATGSP